MALNHYANLGAAREGHALYNIVRIALDRRTPAEAKAWLERDAERSRAKAEEYRAKGEKEAAKIGDYNRPVGPHGPNAAPWFRRAKEAERAADACEEAAELVHMSPAAIESCINDAAEQHAAYERDRAAKSDKPKQGVLL